jgi:hypothetical protein
LFKNILNAFLNIKNSFRFSFSIIKEIMTFATFAILLPCSIVGTEILFFQKGFNSFYGDNLGVDICIISFDVKQAPATNFIQAGSKGFSEFISCGMKLVSPGSVFAQEMGSNAANERPNNSESSSDICYFKGSKFQFYLYAFLGGFIGIGIGQIIIILFYRFTQQCY